MEGRPVRKRINKTENSSSSPSQLVSPKNSTRPPISPKLHLLLLFVCVCSVLYFTRESWIHKLSRERTFTIEELKKYDGSDPDLPIYIGVKGKVFDVTSGRRHYGKQGSYNFFAGRDASRSFATGCFDASDPKCTENSHDFSQVTDEQMTEIDNWLSFYTTHKEYFYVGYIKV